jgi:acyl dehydratase
MKELYFDEVEVGAQGVSPQRTVTEADVNGYADLTGDHTPVHTDEAYARTTPFGTRVAHGLLGLALTDGLKSQSDLRFQPGMSLGWSWDFAAPIKLNDTVQVRFHVASARLSRSRPGWGILVLPAELHNQRGEVVQRGEHRVMVPCSPGFVPPADGGAA